MDIHKCILTLVAKSYYLLLYCLGLTAVQAQFAAQFASTRVPVQFVLIRFFSAFMLFSFLLLFPNIAANWPDYWLPMFSRAGTALGTKIIGEQLGLIIPV